MSKFFKKILLTICSFMFLLTSFMFVGSLKIAQAESSFTMVSGASIRVIEPYGIMFKASVPESDAQDENKNYHMMIIPASYIKTYSLDINSGTCDYYDVLVKALGEEGVADMQCKPYQEDGAWYVRGSLVGILYGNLNREFVGIAYYEENGVRTYADFGTEYTRSIANVASRFISSKDWADADTDVQDFVEDLIVNAYDNSLGNVEGTTDVLPEIAFNYNDIDLLLNENTLQLKSNYAWDVHMDWETSNQNVVTVDDNGVLKTVGAGDATITATVLGEEKVFSVSVYDVPEAFESVYLDPTFTEQNKSYYGTYSAGYSTIQFDNTLDRPSYVHNVTNSYNTSTNEFSISTNLLANALSEGLTTLSVDVKLVAEEGLKDEVNLMWASTAPVVYNSAMKTITTNEWTTMTIDLTTVSHWADASQKAFVVDGDTVTVNCNSFGITSKEQKTAYKVLFSNFRMEATGSSLSGIYVNNTATKTFNLYSNNKAQLLENGAVVESYENCKIYSNGAVKFFNGSDFGAEFASNDYAVVENGKITLDGETYSTPTVKSGEEKIFVDPVLSDNSANYSCYKGNASLSYVFDSTYDRPAYLHHVSASYNTTINEFAFNLDMLTTALKNGFTTLSVDVKLVAGQGLKDEVKLMWASTAPVVYNSAMKTITTNEWTTMTIDLTTVSHWADASQKAFVVDGDTVTVNCKSFGITSKEQSTAYKVLFSNFRVGEQTQTTALSGIYMNTSDVTGETFGREKLAFYSTGEAVITNGTTSTTYECKSYQDGTIKLCADKDNYLAVLLGETIKLTDGTIAYNGDTYTAANFSAHTQSSISNDAYVEGAQPSVTVSMNQYSETTARLVLDKTILNAALAAGYTKLNIYAKTTSTREIKIVLGSTSLWAQQKQGITTINNETYTLFSIDLTKVKNNNSLYCASDPEGDGSYVLNWKDLGISQDHATLDTASGNVAVSFCDYYFSK